MSNYKTLITYRKVLQNCERIGVNLLDLIRIDPLHVIILCERPDYEFEPFVTWNAFSWGEDVTFEHGHYCNTYDKAVKDLFKRAQREGEGILRYFDTEDIKTESVSRTDYSDKFESYREYFANNASHYISSLLAGRDYGDIQQALYKLFLTLNDDQIKILSDTEIGYSQDCYADFLAKEENG